MQTAVKDLIRRAETRPRTIKTLRSTLHALFRKQLCEQEMKALLEALSKEGMVKIDGIKVAYDLPIKVKWTDSPDAGDARHLNCFMAEYPTHRQGYVVCRVPRKTKISDRVTALPWQTFLDEIVIYSLTPAT